MAHHDPFLLDSQYLQFRDSVRAFARTHLADGYLARASSETFPSKAYRRLAQHDLLGLGVPSELGGQEAAPIALGIAVEELCRADFNIGYLAFNAAVWGAEISRYGHRDERERLATRIASGDLIPSGALTEPRGGSDFANIECRAERTNDGWRIYGEKTSVTLGMHADVAATYVRTEPGAAARGVTALLVDLDDPTIARTPFRDPGFKPVGRATLGFDGTLVRERRLLGEPGKGFYGAVSLFGLSRALIGLMCVGVAERAMDLATTHAAEHHAFGAPIGSYQGVSFSLAEHATRIEAARWLCYRTLGLHQAGLPHAKEAAMCKWWCPQLAIATINDCVVLHGHAGWSHEFPLMQMLNDVSGLQIGDGTPQIQKLIIARELLGRAVSG